MQPAQDHGAEHEASNLADGVLSRYPGFDRPKELDDVQLVATLLKAVGVDSQQASLAINDWDNIAGSAAPTVIAYKAFCRIAKVDESHLDSLMQFKNAVDQWMD